MSRHGLLRVRAEGAHARVTFVELFFDLVFVFAVTQLSHTLLEHLTLAGALQVGLTLMAVWWVWIYTSWATNWLNPEAPAVRMLLFGLMLTGLVMAAALPEAFDGKGLAFAVALAVSQLLRTGFLLWAVRRDPPLKRNFQRVLCWFALASALWIGGGLAGGELRLGLWLAALALDYAGPAAAFWTPGMGSSSTTDWTVEGGHMAERCGLFIIIALGESILVTGATFAGLDWNWPTVLGFVVALTGSLAMWWIYFSASAEAASEAIASERDPGRLARLAYTYIHLLLVAGIIVTAVGDELVLAHPLGHTDGKTAATLIGGPGLFLVGSLAFKRAVFARWSPSRLTGLALFAALVPAAGLLSPIALGAATSGVLIFVGAWETLALRPRAVGQPAE